MNSVASRRLCPRCDGTETLLPTPAEEPHMSHARPGARPGAAPRPRPTHLLFLLLALIVAAAALVLPAAGRANAISRPSQTLYTPPSDVPAPRALSPRGLRLQHSGSATGTILATFEQASNSLPVFPIYRSTDNGN